MNLFLLISSQLNLLSLSLSLAVSHGCRSNTQGLPTSQTLFLSPRNYHYSIY
ncbi:hypothetical protein BVRB_4g091830 [Beta vulgaris subsp. vulgaris]|nr:hypothetical protein BVRB_4g091830 [Beta vulgaris subsp. vulgaris]